MSQSREQTGFTMTTGVLIGHTWNTDASLGTTQHTVLSISLPPLLAEGKEQITAAVKRQAQAKEREEKFKAKVEADAQRMIASAEAKG
eukprot:gene5641-6629_t